MEHEKVKIPKYPINIDAQIKLQWAIMALVMRTLLERRQLHGRKNQIRISRSWINLQESLYACPRKRERLGS